MKYLLLIYDEERIWSKMSEAERKAIMGEFMQFTNGLRETGHYKSGSQLQQTPAAKSVRVRDGKQLVTDGPFAETREQLGGYILIEAKNMEEAVEIAARVPSAKFGTVEVRPQVEMSAPATASR